MSVVTSCGDENSVSGTIDAVTPVTNDTSDAMYYAKQKEYLESVAYEFMDLMPSSDLKDITEFDKNNDNDDWDAAGDWAEYIFNALKGFLGTNATEPDSVSWRGYTNKLVSTNYNDLLLASNFTGHFIAQNGKWVLSKADDLQFILKDNTGTESVIKLETSGNVRKVHASNEDGWKDSVWNGNGDAYTNNEYYDKIQHTIGVPEQIIVTLTQGGNQLIKTSVNVDLRSITNENFDISKDGLTVSSVVELRKGYKIERTQVVDVANAKATTTVTMSKNGTFLVSAEVSGNISGIPSFNVNTYSSDTDDITDDATTINAFIKLDFLGKVQFQGTVSDVSKFKDCIDQADEHNTDEATFKSYMDEANGLVDINLFFDGQTTKQGTVKLAYFVDEAWNGDTSWTAEPVVYFYDDSSYSIFKYFFNEIQLKKMIDLLKSLAIK